MVYVVCNYISSFSWIVCFSSILIHSVFPISMLWKVFCNEILPLLQITNVVHLSVTLFVWHYSLKCYIFLCEHVCHLGCDEWLPVAVVTLALNFWHFSLTSTSVF
jgi:hypothetical protein